MSIKTIGVDLGGTNIRAGIKVDDLITERIHTTLKQKDSLSNTLGQLIDVIKPLIHPSVKGIGVAVPSVVDVKNGIVYNVVNIPSWERVELKDILQKTFDIPVQIDNDANCFVLGEHLFGHAKSYKSMVGLVLGTGIGSGIVINNSIYTGSNSGAGEIGYLPYLDKDFEFYCSSSFFTQVHNTTAEQAHLDALRGDAPALKIWHDFGIHIGNAIRAVVYAYDPEAIVFGGSISKAFRFFEPSIEKAFTGFHFPESLRRLRIIQSNNENITLLGAGSLLDQPGR